MPDRTRPRRRASTRAEDRENASGERRSACCVRPSHQVCRNPVAAGEITNGISLITGQNYHATRDQELEGAFATTHSRSAWDYVLMSTAPGRLCITTDVVGDPRRPSRHFVVEKRSSGPARHVAGRGPRPRHELARSASQEGRPNGPLALPISSQMLPRARGFTGPQDLQAMASLLRAPGGEACDFPYQRCAASTSMLECRRSPDLLSLLSNEDTE